SSTFVSVLPTLTSLSSTLVCVLFTSLSATTVLSSTLVFPMSSTPRFHWRPRTFRLSDAAMMISSVRESAGTARVTSLELARSHGIGGDPEAWPVTTGGRSVSDGGRQGPGRGSHCAGISAARRDEV